MGWCICLRGIRDPFLEDLADLEDPMLNTGAKLRVVARI